MFFLWSKIGKYHHIQKNLICENKYSSLKLVPQWLQVLISKKIDKLKCYPLPYSPRLLCSLPLSFENVKVVKLLLNPVTCIFCNMTQVKKYKCFLNVIYSHTIFTGTSWHQHFWALSLYYTVPTPILSYANYILLFKKMWWIIRYPNNDIKYYKSIIFPGE